MRTIAWLFGAVCALGAVSAHADQYAYVTAAQAAEAMRSIAQGADVHTYCAPCGEQVSQPVHVRLVEMGRIWEGSTATPYAATDGQTFWQVYVNDAPVDLAYLYVRDGAGWQNLALRMGLPATSVPERLGAAQTGR